MSRIKFRDTIQYLNENIDAYYIRLKTAAAACEFTASDDEILLQLIQGCNDKRAKIKATQETITLGDMLKFLRSIEATNEASATNYKKEQGGCKLETTYKLENKKQFHSDKAKQTIDKKCFRCAGNYPHPKECRAKGQKCNLCGGLGHFAKCCNSSKSNKSKYNNNQSGDKKVHHTHQVKAFKNDLNETDAINNSNKMINQSYNVFQVSSNESACPRIMVDILGSYIEVGIDTQSSINAISKETFDKMIIKPDLLKDDSIVYSFDGTQPLISIGKFKAIVWANNKSCDAEFIVFQGLRDNLLSYQTSINLKLVKLTLSLNGRGDNFHKNIVEKYPDLLSGKIGRLKDYKLKFHINKDVKPVIQKGRNIPFHLKDAIEKTIDDMIR